MLSFFFFFTFPIGGRSCTMACAELINCRRTTDYELDFLVADPILPNEESHPYARDVSISYTGRLVSRFLLSFLDEKYLFDGQY